MIIFFFFFFFQAEDGIRARDVTGVQTCALPISLPGDGDGLRICGGRNDLDSAVQVFRQEIRPAVAQTEGDRVHAGRRGVGVGPDVAGGERVRGPAVPQFGQMNVPGRVEDLAKDRLTCLNVIAHLYGRANVPVLESAATVRVDFDPVRRDDPDDA